MFMRAGVRGLRFKDTTIYAGPEGRVIDLASSEPVGAPSHPAKRGFDIVLALAACLLLLPLIVMVVALLFATQGRPIFIRHRRIGRDGASFYCLKFRTMVKNAGEVLEAHLERNSQARVEWEATRKLKQDPRVTSFGRVLRKSSVDELPQLLNILIGEMSVVGPRPIVQDEVKYYGPHIEDYLKVRPGLTGLWQVSGRSDVSFKQRVALDSEYARSRTFTGDMWIILKTIPAVLRSQGSY